MSKSGLPLQAGGLNAIAVYVFWIHHEEVETKFDFTGRRDVRQFFKLAQEVGLKALLRAGPWDHGECRNGGHPDWLLDKAKSEHFKLRENNTGCKGPGGALAFAQSHNSVSQTHARIHVHAP